MRVFRLVIGDVPQENYLLNPDHPYTPPQRLTDEHAVLQAAGARVRIEYSELEWKEYG